MHSPVHSARFRPCRALFFLALGMTTAVVSSVYAQSDSLDSAERSAAIDRIGTLLNERYVFADVAKQCAEHLQGMRSDGAFDEVTEPEAFAAQLTTALREASHDKHMLVRLTYVPEAPAAGETNAEAEAPEHPLHARLRRSNHQRQQNFGFETVERLDGNIGYIDLRYFSGHPEARTTAAAAMGFLAHTDALIFDMRKNGGGSPDMVRFLCSYLFDTPTHLNSLYWREGDRTTEFWTIDVPGQPRPDVPVFVLTSSATFSGAEEFSYNVLTQKRGTLVGETTRGGANPGTIFQVDDRIEIFIPTGRAINPVTGTNWEGTGVQPHVEVAADDALDTALPLAVAAAEAYCNSKLALYDAFDPWHTDARRLDSEGNSADAALAVTASLRSAHAVGLVEEWDINMYGYEFLGEERYALSLAAFTLNVELFPDSANAHDSLGEAYRSAGRIEDAIKHYERSIELDPESENADAARAILVELR